MLDKNTFETLKVFSSTIEACAFLGKKENCSGHISDVCLGKTKTAYGYSWKYIEDQK